MAASSRTPYSAHPEPGNIPGVVARRGRVVLQDRRRRASGDREVEPSAVVIEPTLAFSEETTLPIEEFQVFITERDYDIAPDDERLLVILPEDQPGEAPLSTINVVLNWFSELRERVPVP